LLQEIVENMTKNIKLHLKTTNQVKKVRQSSPFPQDISSSFRRMTLYRPYKLSTEQLYTPENNYTPKMNNLKTPRLRRLQDMKNNYNDNKNKNNISSGTPVSTKTNTLLSINEMKTQQHKQPRKLIDGVRKKSEYLPSNETFDVGEKYCYNSLDDLSSDDSYDEDMLQQNNNLVVFKKIVNSQCYVNGDLCDALFSSAPIHINPVVLFPNSDPKLLIRDRNSLWDN
jgi:hypothetical protein